MHPNLRHKDYGSFRVVPISDDDIIINKRDLSAELRGALMEAKELIEGKRKLNTLDNLINEADKDS